MSTPEPELADIQDQPAWFPREEATTYVHVQSLVHRYGKMSGWAYWLTVKVLQSTSPLILQGATYVIMRKDGDTDVKKDYTAKFVRDCVVGMLHTNENWKANVKAILASGENLAQMNYMLKIEGVPGKAKPDGSGKWVNLRVGSVQ